MWQRHFNAGGDNTKSSVLASVRSVLFAVNESVENNKKIFCNVRFMDASIQHHSNNMNSKGFCIFNNVAIGVNYALSSPDIN